MDEVEIKIRFSKKHNRFPNCIVWTPIPCITWLLPFIGHTGICGTDGVIHDFAGSHCITIDNMAFGKPTKYARLSNLNPDIDIDRGILCAD